MGGLAAIGGGVAGAAARASTARPAFTGIVPPANPPANIPMTLGGATIYGCTPTNDTPQCVGPVLHAIDHARALEGVPPMMLPTDWAGLTIAQQVFVVTNLERVARGLPPVIGTVPAFNADAQAGADMPGDPVVPPSTPLRPVVSSWGSIWAGGPINALDSDYHWMYMDGWGGSQATTFNIDCRGPMTTVGCWGHRDNILGGQQCLDCVAGVGYTTVAYRGRTFPSYAELFVWPAQPLTGFTFTWAGNVVPYLPAEPASTPTAPLPGSLSIAPVVGVAATPTGNGYWEVASDGGIFSFGNATFYGSMGGHPLNQPIVGMAATPTGHGYWEVASDGGIFSFGDATFYGSMGGHPLNQPIVGMAATPTGHGYWEVARDGGIFSFGTARFYGSMGGHPLNQPIVGMAAMPTGHGYWEVASDGGIFSFGDATFYGSMGGHPLNQPIVGMAATPTGHGYWEVASDGGIFSFGSAQFHGSMGGHPLNQPIVGMAATPTGNGYWEVASDGGIFSFGSAQFHGSAAT